MAIKTIEPEQWSNYFHEFSKHFLQSKRTDYAEIRVLSEDIGVQNEITWLPLRGITYDHRDDVLDVAVENLNHLIYHPERICVEEDEIGFLSSMEILQSDGTRDIIELR